MHFFQWTENSPNDPFWRRALCLCLLDPPPCPQRLWKAKPSPRLTTDYTVCPQNTAAFLFIAANWIATYKDLSNFIHFSYKVQR